MGINNIPRVKNEKRILGGHPYRVTAWFCLFHFVMPPNVSVIVPRYLGDVAVCVAVFRCAVCRFGTCSKQWTKNFFFFAKNTIVNNCTCIFFIIILIMIIVPDSLLPWGEVRRLRCDTTTQHSTSCPCFWTFSNASSQIDFSNNSFSPRQTPSAVIKTLAFESDIRSANESDE